MLSRVKPTGNFFSVNVTTPFDRHRAKAPALTGEAWLAEQRDPVLIVDPVAHQLVSCNAAGAACLGIGDARAIDLDPSMPGWGAIKAHAAFGLNAAPHDDTILFWTPSGPKALTGRLETVRYEDRALVLIVIGPRSRIAVPKPVSSPAPAPQDDLATLREIARRIRAGSRPLQQPSPATPLPAHEAEAAPDEQKDESARSSRLVVTPSPKFPPPLNFEQLVFPFETEASTPSAPAQNVISNQTERPELIPNRSNTPSALATLAHELRTPLSAIVSLAEIMRDERLGAMGNPRYKAYAGDIHDSARHTLDLVHAMMEGERDAVPDERRHLDFDEVDLNAIARSCGLAMQPIASRAGVQLETKLSQSIPLVLANGRAIRQMIFNVLSNALRFTPHGGLIKITTQQNGEKSVLLEISDSGTGISKSDIARILAPIPAGGSKLAAANLSTSSRGSGSGIGLPLVRQLVDAHGATLAIVSDPKQGTRITITFAKSSVILN